MATRHGSSVLRVAALVSLAVGALHGGVALADDGSLGIRLVDAPAATADDPRALVYIVDHLAPGATVERRIEISNTTDATMHVDAYAAAATIDAGTFTGAVGHTANDLSSWTSVDPVVHDVDAGAVAIATVTIAVPLDAAPGEQYGVVWAEARSALTGGVVQVNRVGIRLYVSVGPGGPPAADFTIDTLTAARSTAGDPQVIASVHNTGGRALDMSGTLLLSDGPAALSAGPFPVLLGVTLSPGAAGQVVTTLDPALPNGPWLVALSLHSGLVERTVTATLTFPGKGSGPAVSAASDDHGGISLAGVLSLSLVVLALVGAVMGAVVFVRRARRQDSGWNQLSPHRMRSASEGPQEPRK